MRLFEDCNMARIVSRKYYYTYLYFMSLVLLPNFLKKKSRPLKKKLLIFSYEHSQYTAGHRPNDSENNSLLLWLISY